MSLLSSSGFFKNLVLSLVFLKSLVLSSLFPNLVAFVKRLVSSSVGNSLASFPTKMKGFEPSKLFEKSLLLSSFLLKRLASFAVILNC